jgi:putative flippase GtrA
MPTAATSKGVHQGDKFRRPGVHTSATSQRRTFTCVPDHGAVESTLLGRIPATLVGFVLINGFTFGVDLAVLTGLHGGLHWPVPVAITGGYATAFLLSFVLNRRFNFRSHARVGPQVRRYVVVVALNFLVLVLGFGDALVALGIDYRLARVIVGAVEVCYLYAALRWLVFADDRRREDALK